MNSKRVTGQDWSSQWFEVVLHFAILGDGYQLEVVARQVERQSSLLVELLLGGIVLTLHRPVSPAGAVLGQLNHVTARSKLRRSNIDRQISSGGGISSRD